MDKPTVDWFTSAQNHWRTDGSEFELRMAAVLSGRCSVYAADTDRDRATSEAILRMAFHGLGPSPSVPVERHRVAARLGTGAVVQR